MTISPINKTKSKQIDNLLTQKSRFGWMPIVVILTLLTNCFLTLQVLRLSKITMVSRPYIYVQKPEGVTDIAQPVDKLHRTDAVLSSYAEDWLKLAYTWRSNKPNAHITEGNIKYPLPLHMASHAIAPGYRETYLVSTHHKYNSLNNNQFNFNQYLTGQYQSHIRVFEQPVVKQIKPGLWDVTVIATRTHTQGNSVIAQEKFNHQLRLKAIDPGNSRITFKNPTSLEKLFSKTQLQGLQIVKISQY